MPKAENLGEKRPVIAITMGDPAGIGPEIIASALASSSIYQICNPVVIGDSRIMQRAVEVRKNSVQIHEISSLSQALFSHGTIDLLNLSELPWESVNPRNPSGQTGQAMIDYINRAVDLAISREVAAMVTAPVTKTAMKMAGSRFHGHTELIAHRTGTEDYAMMLAGEKLKVVLVTIHIPLSEVPGSLTVESILRTVRIAGSALKYNFGIAKPVIAVAGLNPHAGEESMFGSEEERIIIPAVARAREAQFNSGEFDVEGPFPPDTIFYHAAQGKYDCVICMYHDQGLIPFKLLHFSDGVNTTLGLPIIRTSVDHGTAYDIAWQNRADHSSLVQAIRMAVWQANSLKKE